MTCIVCGSYSYYEIPEKFTCASPVAICKQCGHVYNLLPSTLDALQSFLDTEFSADPACRKGVTKSELALLHEQEHRSLIEFISIY